MSCTQCPSMHPTYKMTASISHYSTCVILMTSSDIILWLSSSIMIFPDFFIYLKGIYLKSERGKDRVREIFHPPFTTRMTTSAKAGPGQRLEPGASPRSHHMGGRHSSVWTISMRYLRHISRELNPNWNN